MNKIILGAVIGVGVTLLVGALVGYLMIFNGWLPARGDERPDKLEKWVAQHALKATLKREGVDKSPIEANESNLMAGAKIYANNCSGCHGTPITPTPTFARGFNPGPTLFGDGDLVTDDPEGWTYWKTFHGIKFTGMPSFSKMLKPEEIWQVTLFLKNMDKLPPSVNDYWKKMK